MKKKTYIQPEMKSSEVLYDIITQSSIFEDYIEDEEWNGPDIPSRN